MRRALAIFVFASLVTGGCTDSSVDDDGAADIDNNTRDPEPDVRELGKNLD